jgi:uncharacterized protein DUF6949
MSLESLQSVIVVLIGFSVAGLLATGYQLVTERPLSFRLLNAGPQPVTFLAIPVLTFAAPFVIMRNVMRGRRIEGRRFEFVMLATMIAGLWSLLSGTVVVSAFTALSHLFV